MSDAKHMTTCYVCGATVDTLEVSQGGSEDGCQLANNDEWVCSLKCWDAVAGPPAQEMIQKDVALAMVATSWRDGIRAAAHRYKTLASPDTWNFSYEAEDAILGLLDFAPADAQAALDRLIQAERERCASLAQSLFPESARADVIAAVIREGDDD